MSFDAFTATLFADPNLSEPATYNAAPVRVIRRTASADFHFEGTTLRSDAVTFKLRVADVPMPAEGDVILDTEGNVYVVQASPARTMRGLAWLVEAVPA